MKSSHLITADMRPIFKWLLWILGGIVVLLLILQILITFFADDYVASRLKESVRSGSDSTYALRFDNLNLNIFQGSISLHTVKILSDTSAFSSPAVGKRPPGMLFSGTMEELEVSGVNVYSAIMGDALHIGAITITEPDLTARKNPNPLPKDTSKSFSSVDSSIYAVISKRYSELSVDEVNIYDARLLELSGTDTLAAAAKLNLGLRSIHVDSASAHSGRRFVTDNGSLHMQGLMVNLPDHLNKIRLKQLSISSDEQSVSIDSMQLIPRYPRFQFSKRKGTQIDRMNLTVPKLRIRDIDFSLLADSARFHASSVLVNDADLNDFHSKIPPFPMQQRPPLPHMALKQMSLKLKIDTLHVRNANIAYSEYHPKAPKAGTVTFKKLQATFHNITNYPELIDQGATITMDARTYVMGQGLLQTHFTFPMNTKNGFHKVRGELSSMPMPAFNRMVKYVAFARIDKGTLNKLDFDMTLDGQTSSGSLIMNYENLKISMLDKKSMKQKGIMKNLITFAANNFVIKNNNTPEKGMRAGPIHFSRIQRKGVFNYWWKSLLSGIKQSVH